MTTVHAGGLVHGLLLHTTGASHVRGPSAPPTPVGVAGLVAGVDKTRPRYISTTPKPWQIAQLKITCAVLAR